MSTPVSARSSLELTPEQLPVELDALRAEVREFVAAELAAGSFTPKPDCWVFAPSREFTKKMADRGWLGMAIPARYGGHEKSMLERFVICEELVAAGAPVNLHWGGDRQVAPGLLNHGTEEQRRRFLPGIASGDVIFAIGLSEPDSGSDLASVRTRAEKVDGGWKVTGTKIWTSAAHLADAILTLVRTGDGGKTRHEGLTQMIIEVPNENIVIRPIVSLNGEHHFNEVVFDGAFVPDEMVLGEVGGGWSQITAELAFERSGPERILSTVVLLRELAARNALDTQTLGRLTSRMWALREASISIAFALTSGHAPDTAASVVKDLGTRFEREVLDAARATGVEPDLDSDDPVARLLAHAIVASPTATLRGGTNEILRGIIARALGVR